MCRFEFARKNVLSEMQTTVRRTIVLKKSPSFTIEHVFLKIVGCRLNEQLSKFQVDCGDGSVVSGDVSTLADPAVVESLVSDRKKMA